MNFPGSNSGSKKAIPSGDSQSFPDTAHPKSNALKIIGSISAQNTKPISPASNTFSVTALILERTAASSAS
jgi:hypothetical protein